YCTKETGMTHKGEPCVEECSTRGYSFNVVRKTDTSFWVLHSRGTHSKVENLEEQR
ncbi:Uncharacterized protein FKW44_003589, partial [Caligus rogercresseyi]